MKNTEKRTTTSTYTITTSINCDKCGKTTLDDDRWPLPTNIRIDDSFINICETTVMAKIGYHTSDGGNYIEYTADICPTCFFNLLRHNGILITETEVDY